MHRRFAVRGCSASREPGDLGRSPSLSPPRRSWDQSPPCRRGELIRRGRDAGVRGRGGRRLGAWIPLSGGASSTCSGTGRTAWLGSLCRDHRSRGLPRRGGMCPGAASGLPERVLWGITGAAGREGSCRPLLPRPHVSLRHRQVFAPSRGDLWMRSLPLALANSLQHLSCLRAVWGLEPPSKSC